MTSLRITGGVPLTGQVTVRGAKNLVPKAMVAALLGASASTLGNVPEIKDVEVVTDLLSLHGVEVTRDDALGRLTLDPTNVTRARHADIDAHAGIPASPSCCAVRCCTHWVRRSSRISVAAGSGTARSTTTWRCCATSVPRWRSWTPASG